AYSYSTLPYSHVLVRISSISRIFPYTTLFRSEVSMLEAMSHFNIDSFTHYFAANEIMGPYSRPTASQSYVVQCQDGQWLALHMRSEEHTSELQSRSELVCRLLLDKKSAHKLKI